MRILRVLTSVDLKHGGPVEGVVQSSKILSDLGHTNEVASLDHPDDPCVAAFPLPVHALGPGKMGYKYAKGFVPWLRQNATHYDCVVVHGLWQYSGFGTWRALRHSRTPYYVFTHG